MRERKEIKGLSFEDFKKITLEKVRKDNHLSLVESWEDNVLHSEFYKNSSNSYYSSTVYFIGELSGKNHYIKMYTYCYSSEIFYEDGYEIIDTVVLSKIALLENLISNNKDRYLYGTLKEYQECTDKIYSS